ncbi:hypothetical protein H2201_008965 [Coniosporium apollinis]|uniref:DNA 3'-5' helicase n=1 Tax=Coniosporium apollinis TaxID=61459 RepID=A0ABQ9NGU5_9PEZI|nr:hypothetical protein H2201_008965 [Coniosporium apollinis]
MKRHVSKDHGFKTKQHGARPLWKACLLQTFFAENRHINYFVVHDSCEAEKPSGDPRFALSSMAEEVEQQLTRKIQELEESEAGLNSRGHRTQVSPWLEMTRWSVYLCGQDLRVAARLVELPDPNTDDGCLLAVVAAFDRVIEQARNSILEDRVSVFDQHRINSFIRGRTAARPIVSKLRDGTYKKYKEVWKRLLCFVYRMICKNQQPSLHCVITNAQSRALDEMINAARAAHAARAESNFNTERERSSIGGLQPVPQDVLDLRCLEFSVSLLDHCLKGNIYDSVVVGFLAVLGINVKELGFYDAGRYTSHLSALIKMAQMLVVQRAVAAADMGEVDYPADLLEEMQDRFMVYGSRSPINWAQKLRTYGSKIRDTTTSLGRIDWSEDGQRLRYKELELDMEGLRRLVRTETELAQEQLAGLLLIRPDESREDIVPALCLRRLRDDPTIQQKGWSFIDDKRNAELHGYERWLLRRVLECEWLQEEFLARPKWMKPSRSSMAAAKWKAQAVEHYLAQRNGERRRNLSIQHGRVIIHTTYHKGQQQTGAYKDNIRFLPSAVGDLLLDYIVCVIPLRQSFLRQSAPKALISPYLWWKDDGVWADNRLTRSMEGACARAEAPRLHISNWRQMTVAIVKTKFASELSCFDPDLADEDAEEIDEDIRIMTKQRNHTTRTVNRAYANQNNANFGNVWDGLIRRSLRASTLWKDLWGLDVVLKGKKRFASEEVKGPAMVKKVAMGVYRPKKAWSPAALLGGVRSLYGKEDMAWRSPEQERAMTTIMSWTEQVLVILPTGSGKSLLFMLPCTLPDAGVTVLVVPLVSLRGDLLRRLRELGIDHLVWLPGETREAGLVLVTVEAASTGEFMAYGQRLVAGQRLDRIVVDECHLTVTAAEYRQSMVDLAVIRSLRTQFVYLTATLPPAMQAEFEEQNHLLNPKVIRASSNRPNLFYIVRKAERRGNLLEQSAYEAQEAWRNSGLFDHSRDKIILYVRTRAEADELSVLLGCAIYTAKIGTATEKEEVLTKWTGSADQPCMVATTALGAGFDYPHIRLVMHVNEPDSIIDFAQESGRAGRDGRQAYSFVMLPASWEAQQEPHAEEPVEAWEGAGRDIGLRKKRERRAIQEYLRGVKCFRTCLSEHLDLPVHRRWCMKEEDVACEVCKVGHDEVVPPLPERAKEGEAKTHTGAAIIQRKRQEAYLELSRYREDLLQEEYKVPKEIRINYTKWAETY